MEGNKTTKGGIKGGNKTKTEIAQREQIKGIKGFGKGNAGEGENEGKRRREGSERMWNMGEAKNGGMWSGMIMEWKTGRKWIIGAYQYNKIYR